MVARRTLTYGAETGGAGNTWVVWVVCGVAAFAGGLVGGWLLLRRVRPRVGPSWEDWRYAEQIGGRWAWWIYGATLVLSVGVVYGFFLPSWLRAGITGALVGFCMPFLTEGLRRLRSANQ